MMSNNKILTVSYGTFSCTLEGFDDSFGTMKAIAEYFRDLAADDRYFGAEPPQPDAQMLARIAQRQISRHVEAREDEGRIVLSAKNTPQAAAQVASDVVGDVATAVADATIARYGTDEAVGRIDAAPEPTEPFAHESGTATTGDVAAEDTAAVGADTPVVADAQADTPDIVPSLPDAEVEAFFAESPAGLQQDEEPDETLDELDHNRARAESIADKLKRIRAVVSHQTVAQPACDYSEDEHAEADKPDADKPEAVHFEDEIHTGAASDAVLAETLRDLEDALDADDEIETAQETPDNTLSDDAESDDDNITAILGRLDQESVAADMAQDDTHPQAVTFDDDDDDMDGNILAAMDTVEAVDPSEAGNLFDDDEAVQQADETPAPETEEPVTAAPRARILRVKRATLEAAVEEGKLEEYDDEESNEDSQPQGASAPLRKAPVAGQSSLSDEAEAELTRELAALEAEMAAQKTDQKNATPQTDAHDTFEFDILGGDPVQENALHTATVDEDRTAPSDEAAPEPRSDLPQSADADLSRLLEETDTHMQEPQNATRRDAFTQLRAAVAAKKADEAVVGASSDEENDGAYRDDLANVVRPRRPVSGAHPKTERPAEPRPAPLKLVAEQRIDIGEPRQIVPVRPRRVAALGQSSATPANAVSFEEFANDMGAEKLPDLLEAAAAYLSFVEGHAQFSRPQLMSKVRQVEQESFTREDSLRSFGKLLRDGKIEKLSGGRFQASDHIGFKPDARAVG